VIDLGEWLGEIKEGGNGSPLLSRKIRPREEVR